MQKKEKKFPLLSLITCVYNTPLEFLKACFESLINQSYQNFELIVVNDFSDSTTTNALNDLSKKIKNIKIINNPKNLGLLQSRIVGMQHIKGECVAFIDSDDFVSIDYYRKLVFSMIQNNSDLVMSDFLEYEVENKKTFYYPNLVKIFEPLIGSKCFNFFLEREFLHFSWSVVWNKLYSKKIITKILKDLSSFKKHINMCEDVLISFLAFSYCQKLTSIENDYYYYYCRSDKQMTKQNKKFEKILKSLDDIKDVFDFIEQKFLTKTKTLAGIHRWKRNLLKFYFRLAKSSDYTFTQQNILKQLIEEINPNFAEFYQLNENSKNNEANYLNKKILKTNHNLLEIKNTISSKDCKVISFDLFDTLITRPFFDSVDLFLLMSYKINKMYNTNFFVDFKKVRIEAEKRARTLSREREREREDVTLDEIYEQVLYLLPILKDKIELIKNLEIEYELKFLKVRKIGQELFEFASFLGKKILIISDMYLDSKIILKILEKNGYKLKVNDVFVSQKTFKTKATGSLFDFVFKKQKINFNEWVHIGDNYQSDFIKPKQKGIISFWLPKSIDVFLGKTKFFKNDFIAFLKFDSRYGDFNFFLYFYLKTCIAIVANKIFDNPFFEQVKDSDFNANPYFIGYFCLGMHLFSLTHWLIEETQKNNYQTFNFNMRDGYLPMQAYNFLKKNYKLNVKVNQTHFNRESMLAFMFLNTNDLFTLNHYFKVKINRQLLMDKINEIYQQQIINEADIEEKNTHEFILKIYYKLKQQSKSFNFDQNDFKKNYLDQFFIGNTAIFDIGYSGRIGAILKNVFNYNCTEYYWHINSLQFYDRLFCYDLKIKTFYDFIPQFPGLLREQFYSSSTPSCINFLKNAKGKYVKVFRKKAEFNSTTSYVLQTLQKAALTFVKDVINIFQKDVKYLYGQHFYMSAPLEYFFLYSKQKDKEPFILSNFENDFDCQKEMNIKSYWDKVIQPVRKKELFSVNRYQNLSKVSKFIMLWILDRGKILQVVNNLTLNKPIINKGLKKIFRLYKKIRGK